MFQTGDKIKVKDSYYDKIKKDGKESSGINIEKVWDLAKNINILEKIDYANNLELYYVDLGNDSGTCYSLFFRDESEIQSYLEQYWEKVN